MGYRAGALGPRNYTLDSMMKGSWGTYIGLRGAASSTLEGPGAPWDSPRFSRENELAFALLLADGLSILFYLSSMPLCDGKSSSLLIG